MKRIYQLLLPIFLLLAFVIPRTGAQTIVAEYSFTGNAKDSSPNHNDATVHGASLTQDRFGRANQRMHLTVLLIILLQMQFLNYRHL